MAAFMDRVVLITGASSGIGQSTAIEFARQGATLALTGRNKERLSKTAEMCSDVGLSVDKIFTVTGDLENEAELRKLFEDAVTHFGRLDVLVNNGGEAIFEDFETCGTDKLDSMYKQHMRAPYELCRLAVPHLEKSKGSIVNVTTVFTTLAARRGAAYLSMKAALDHFTRIIAHELAPRGIRVNTVNPGAIGTPLMADYMAKAGGDLEKGRKMFGEMHPVGRVGEPEEIARAIVYLSSPQSGFITGTNHVVDGGLSLAGAGRF